MRVVVHRKMRVVVVVMMREMEEMEDMKETEEMEETEGTEGTEETQGICSGEVKPDVSLNSLGTGKREVTASSGGREPAEAAINLWPILPNDR